MVETYLCSLVYPAVDFGCEWDNNNVGSKNKLDNLKSDTPMHIDRSLIIICEEFLILRMKIRNICCFYLEKKFVRKI